MKKIHRALVVALSTASLPVFGQGGVSPEAAVPPAQVAAPPDSAAIVDTQGPEIEAAGPLETIPVSEESDEARPDTARTVKNRAIEEIVVTAQKREERLQDVPISIQAFSGDALAARGIEKTEDLGQAIPSLQFSGAVGFQLIYLRGLGTDNFIPSADPSVATYVDGIYIPNAQAAATSLGNIERVEVLKGPQGTLFGRNSTGGAISVTTKEPGNTVEASAEGELGDFDSRSVKVNLSGPITDWFSAGISGVYSREDSYYTNLNYSADPSILKAGRLKLNLQATDDLALRLTAFYSEQSGLGSLINKNTEPSLLGRAVGIQAQKDNYKAELDFPVGSSSEQTVIYGDLIWNLPRFDFKLMLSDADITTKFAATDFDGSRMPIVGFDVAPNYSRPKTAELQILSNADSWAADTFEWVAGLYYLDSRAGLDPVSFYAAPGALTSGFSLAGLAVPSTVSNLVDRLPLQSTPLGTDGVTVQLAGILATESYSAYAQGTYKFTDWLDLTLGGRYQEEKRFLTKSTTGTVSPLTGEYIELIPWPLDSKTAKTFSPKAVLSFHPRENALLYTSYTVGYKSGTFNIANLYVPPNYIVPEKVTTVEAGAKVDFFDGLLRLNGAVFNNQIDNLQTGFVSLLTSGAVLFITAPEARTRGAEIDGTLIPLPTLNPGLALTGNAAYVDAKYKDFPNAKGFDPTTGLLLNNVDASGKCTTRTPRLSGGIGLVQTIESSNGTYELAVDTYYNSGFFYDFINSVEEDAYATLNAHASYLHAPWNLRVTVFGQNLLDERYHLQQFQTDFGINKTLAPPVQYGVRLRWDFQ